MLNYLHSQWYRTVRRKYLYIALAAALAFAALVARIGAPTARLAAKCPIALLLAATSAIAALAARTRAMRALVATAFMARKRRVTHALRQTLDRVQRKPLERTFGGIFDMGRGSARE